MSEKTSIQPIGLEIKKIGISTLQGWDQNVKHNLQIQKNILDNLFQRLETLMRRSL